MKLRIGALIKIINPDPAIGDTQRDLVRLPFRVRGQVGEEVGERHQGELSDG